MRAGVRAAVAGVVGGLVLLSGCDGKDGGGDDGSRDGTETMDNQRIVDEISDELAGSAGDGFTSVDGTYRDDASTAEEVTFVIRCDACDGPEVIDRVVGAVWTSGIAPLRTISVSVNGPGGYDAETVVVADREGELVERYGERPSG